MVTDARKAVRMLQRSLRRRRWLHLVSSISGGKIKLRRSGYCGISLFPIRSFDGALTAYEGQSGQQYSLGGWGALSLDSAIRMLCISAVESSTLGHAVLAAILANCVFLAVQGPPETAHPWLPEAEAHQLELFFTLAFTVEMVVRMGALGFAGHQHAYLADPWNVLDFCVVFSAWIPLLLPQLGNVSALRAIRAAPAAQHQSAARNAQDGACAARLATRAHGRADAHSLLSSHRRGARRPALCRHASPALLGGPIGPIG